LAHIPKEQQTAFQRWELKSFGDERPSTLAARQREEAEVRAAAEAAAAEEAARQAEYEAFLNAPAPPAYPTEEELAAIREEARLQGYQDGYAEGHRAGEDEAIREGEQATAAALAPLAGLADQFAEALRGADQLIAQDVLELAMHLARTMVRQALPVKPELIVPIVRDAVDTLPSVQQPAVLLLNPDDAAVVRSAIGDELAKDGWRIAEDESIARGGCRLDTATNQVDAQIESRWTRLAAALGKNVEWLD
jgi:flagellar assembly protein FliH